MADQDPSANRVTVTIASQSPLPSRFEVPVERCEVVDKKRLAQYRQKWMQWMTWYQGDSEPHSIESQIRTMLFNDLTYRAIVSVRESAGADISVSARSATLAYLLDQGYVVSQVLSIQKLLDTRKGVISVRRLLNDVEKNRGLITREVYVSGTGIPYDYNSWSAAVSPTDPMVQMWGLEAPALRNYAVSKYLHETFDLLSGKQPSERAPNDAIPQSIFKTLGSWISGSSASEVKSVRDNFIAHSADGVRRGSAKFTGVRFSEIDELQRAIVRVERALTDHVLSIRVTRDVVPMPPLGIFQGLDLPYSPSEAKESMHRCWKDLEAERNTWKDRVVQDLTANSSYGRVADPNAPSEQSP